jgi:hypothetical protein
MSPSPKPGARHECPRESQNCPSGRDNGDDEHHWCSAMLMPNLVTTHSVRIVPSAKPAPNTSAKQSTPAFRIGITFWCLSVRAAYCRLKVQRLRGVPLDMSRIHPECPDSASADRSVAASVLLRQEPDEEEEEEEEDDRKEDDDAEDEDDVYSE